jgi:hypothetical protein
MGVDDSTASSTVATMIARARAPFADRIGAGVPVGAVLAIITLKSKPDPPRRAGLSGTSLRDRLAHAGREPA